MCSRKNALCRAADSVLPFPASLRFPVGIAAKKNAQSRNEQTKSDNRTDDPRTHDRRSRPTAEWERNISQAVLFGAHAANSRRDRAKNIPREPRKKRDPRRSKQLAKSCTPCDRNAKRGVRGAPFPRAPKRTLPPGLQRIRLISPFSRDEPSAGRTQNAAREPHRRAEQPPRPPTLRPELKPAKRNIAPAHDSRPHEAERRSAASARDSPRFQTKAARRPPARNHIPQPTVTPPPRPISVTPDYQKRCCRYETSGVPDADFPADADAP